MRVQVDEARQQRRVAEIDHRRAGGDRQRRRDLLNPLAGDANHRGLERRSAAAVDKPCGFHDDLLGADGYGSCRHQHKRQNGEDGPVNVHMSGSGVRLGYTRAASV